MASVAILALFGLAWLTPAHASAPVSNAELVEIVHHQRALIEAQRKGLEALQKRVEDLEGRSVQAVGAVRAAEPDGEDGTPVGEPQTTAATAPQSEGVVQEVQPVDLSREADRTLANQGMHIPIPRFETSLTVSGLVKADFIHDFREMDALAQFIPAAIVVPGDSNGQTTFSANPSRFIIATATSTGYGRLTTMFSMDLFGDTLGRKPEPRLRQAWGQFDDILFGGGIRAGQSWSSWDNVPALPETLDFWGPNGSDQTRQPLLRWIRPIGENWTVWASVEDPEAVIAGDAVGDPGWPDGVLTAIYTGEWGQVKPAVLLRGVGASNLPNNDTFHKRAFGWGVSGSGIVNLPWLAPADNLRWEVQYGKGIGSYINSQVPDANVFGSEMKLIPVFAGYVALQHWWHERLRSNATFGWLDIDNQGVEAPDALNRTFYTAGNLIWSPVPRVDLGVEFLWGQRRDKNGREGSDPRLQFSAHYRF